LKDNNYSVIVFDLGNVLIPFDYDIVVKRFNDIEEGLGDKFVKLYSENYEIHKRFERWEISTDEFLKIMMEWLEYKVTLEEFYDIYSKIFSLNIDTVNLLPELKKRYKLVLLSNTNYIHQKYGYEHYEFLKHFDKLILSHEAGAVKPEEKIYKAVENFTASAPQEHLFIDDVEEYVEGAKKMGWDAVQFSGYQKLIKDLRERNIL
jgi:putative hydrolase of the HAD superfamily